MDRIDATLCRRAQIATRYQLELVGDYFCKPQMPSNGKTTWQTYHILLSPEIDQHSFLNYLKGQGVGANYGAQCIPVQDHYKRKYGYEKSDFPNSYAAFSKGVALPMYDLMTDKEVSYVIETINNFQV